MSSQAWVIREQIARRTVAVMNNQGGKTPLTPEDFGAAGDGVTDDSAAVQAWLVAIISPWDWSLNGGKGGLATGVGFSGRYGEARGRYYLASPCTITMTNPAPYKNGSSTVAFDGSHTSTFGWGVDAVGATFLNGHGGHTLTFTQEANNHWVWRGGTFTTANEALYTAETSGHFMLRANGFNTGRGYFNFAFSSVMFKNVYYGLATDEAFGSGGGSNPTGGGNCPIWGVSLDDVWGQGMTGPTIRFKSSAGQPANRIGHTYITGDNLQAGAYSMDFANCSQMVIDNAEFLNHTRGMANFLAAHTHIGSIRSENAYGMVANTMIRNEVSNLIIEEFNFYKTVFTQTSGTAQIFEGVSYTTSKAYYKIGAGTLSDLKKTGPSTTLVVYLFNGEAVWDLSDGRVYANKFTLQNTGGADVSNTLYTDIENDLFGPNARGTGDYSGVFGWQNEVQPDDTRSALTSRTSRVAPMKGLRNLQVAHQSTRNPFNSGSTTVAVSGNAGSSGSAVAVGTLTDTAGTVRLTVGGTGIAAGSQFTVTFQDGYLGGLQAVILSGGVFEDATARGASGTSFTASAKSALAAGTYDVGYVVYGLPNVAGV